MKLTVAVPEDTAAGHGARRPGKCSLSIDSAGLVLNIIGIGLVFWFGLPAELSRADCELLFPREPADVTRARMYDVLGYAGLILLMAGFGLQLLSNALEAQFAGMPF